MTAHAPLITLNNGVEMPALGLGVFQSPPEETAQAVRAALDGGYRLIDTAAVYGNEHEVGEGLRASDVDRSEVFIETKVWITDFGSTRRSAPSTRAPESSASTRSTSSSSTNRCHRPSAGRSVRTARWRRSSPTAASARSA